MVFAGQDLRAVYQEIRRREDDAGAFSLVEFDDAEYSVLRTLGQSIVSGYQRSPLDSQRMGRAVFLAFACEHVRRHKYTSDNVFWDEFEGDLVVRPLEHRIMLNDLLWEAFGEEGIPQQTGQVYRLIARSLVSEVIDDAPRALFLGFFAWYYRRSAGSEVNAALLEQYFSDRRIERPVPVKAVSALDRDCRILAAAVHYAIEHGLFLSASNLESCRQTIIRALGHEFDVGGLRLLRDKRTLVSLVNELQNNRTPVQFMREVRRHRRGNVLCPDGQLTAVLTARQRWRPADLRYGLYRIGDIEYRVVPTAGLTLDAIAQWPFEQVVPLRDARIGYKKRAPFKVRVGSVVAAARQCIWQDESDAYVWAGEIPLGQPLVIDGHACEQSEGLQWDAHVCLAYNDDGEPWLAVGVDRLVAYYPHNGGRRLQITNSQGYDHVEHLGIDGTVQLYRAISMPLDAFCEPVVVSVSLDGRALNSRTMAPRSAYLFSRHTHKPIAAGSTVACHDREYFLFCTDSMPPSVSDGATIEVVGASLCPYTLYRLLWHDTSSSLHITTSESEWFLSPQGFLYVSTQHGPINEMVDLAERQAYSFREAGIRIRTNLDPKRTRLLCQVTFLGELVAEAAATDCLRAIGDEGTYCLADEFLNDLHVLTWDRPGRYDVLFCHGEEILDLMTLALVPRLKVRIPDLEKPVHERDPILALVLSPDLPVWDPTRSAPSSSATLSLRAHVSAEGYIPNASPTGVHRLVSRPISTPVVFPTIGETVHLTFKPAVFAMRLYEAGLEIAYDGERHARLWLAEMLYYYTLDQAALYVLTVPEGEVELRIDGAAIWSGSADAEGHLLVQGLGFLRQHCLTENTVVTVASSGLKQEFSVRWPPLVHDVSEQAGCVGLCFSGPTDTAIIVRVVQINGHTVSEQRMACEGGRSLVSLRLPPAPSTYGSYVVIAYQLSDGTELQAAPQWRVETLRGVPAAWLAMGLGVSSDDVLRSFALEHLGEG